jgi:hypothetical protein
MPAGDVTPEVRAQFLARNWSSPTYAAMSVEIVDALLARVLQGRASGFRDHMLDVCAQVSRGFTKPWMDSQLALAWEAGYLRGVADEASDLERADNPYADPSP